MKYTKTPKKRYGKAVVESYLKDFEEIAQRLVEDYNDGKRFEQKEEDRLVSLAIADIVKQYLENIKL
jgi:hypothetical protein